MIVLDNSEWNRNGDFYPNRFEAQRDAALIIFEAKMRANVESAVGLATMAGSTPGVHITPTADKARFERILFDDAILSIAPGQELSQLARAMQVCQLVLKHRSNMNQQQRIVAFVGSPLVSATAVQDKSDANTQKEASAISNSKALQDELMKMAKGMRKNGIALDLIIFGQAAQPESLELAARLVETVNQGGNSHLLVVPTAAIPELSPSAISGSPVVQESSVAAVAPAVQSLKDALNGSAILGGRASVNEIEMGFDPETDPELAMAIRLSMEEHARSSGSGGAGGSSGAASGGDVVMADSSAATQTNEEDDEDEELRRAIAMSLEDQNQPSH